MSDTDQGFYEDDEPVEKIAAAFQRGEKHLTRAPRRGQTEYLRLRGLPYGRPARVSDSSTRSPNKATKELAGS